MLRPLAAVLAAGFACSLTGCVGGRLTPTGGSPVVGGAVVDTPALSPAAADTADRVSTVGADLVAATPLGIPEVDFLTIGAKEPELFHQSGTLVYVSDGLAASCRTDAELAAVLATQVGRLTAEFRRAARRDIPDAIPSVATAPKLDGSTSHDPAGDVYLAELDKAGLSPAGRRNWPTTDANKIAGELLRNAGYDPELLAEVAPLMKEAGKGRAGKQLVPTAAPKWSW